MFWLASSGDSLRLARISLPFIFKSATTLSLEGSQVTSRVSSFVSLATSEFFPPPDDCSGLVRWLGSVFDLLCGSTGLFFKLTEEVFACILVGGLRCLGAAFILSRAA